MTAQIFKNAWKIALPVLAVAFAVPAFAGSVDFTTTAEFCTGACTSGVSSISFATGSGNQASTLNLSVSGFSYTNFPIGDGSLDAFGNPKDDANLATIDTTASGSNAIATTGEELKISVFQSNPAGTGCPGTSCGNLLGTFSGSIGKNAQGAVITFSGPITFTLAGNVIYTLDSPTWEIPDPGNNLTGVTTITATVTPEPTFMALTGLGFAGLAFVAYRRRRTA